MAKLALKGIFMKILLFYDNFIRDFRGLLFLKLILEHIDHKCFLEPLFKNAIYTIRKINPDTVIMGQLGEQSTSLIGIFCFKNGINLCINTTEFMEKCNNLHMFFKINQKEFNDRIIDIQVLGGKFHHDYIYGNANIIYKDKYKLTGIPRMDFNIIPELRDLETKHIKNKYNLIDKNIYLYVSSFIYDGTGGQIVEENKAEFNYNERYLSEKKLKVETVEILSEFTKTLNDDDLLLIKKHPWDKSNFLEDNLKDKATKFVDQFEYIVPLISVSDLILHDQSTVAVEAWIQKKNTISINPFFDGYFDNMKYQMKYDTIVKNCDELISCIKHYPEKSKDEFLGSFNYKMDGKATIRVAKEIIKLKPKKTKKKQSLNSGEKFKDIWENIHLKSHSSVQQIPLDSYAYLLLLLENQRDFVEKMYKKPIEKYIDTMVRENDFF